MSCILRISDPILKGILGKDKFNSIQELRDSFMLLADKHSVLPLDINIKGSKGNYNTQKFGKIYKEGEEVKLEIVMPGQEYFSEFEWSTNLPENFRTFYGDTDNKVLTFESIDSFLGFYLANFLYVTPSNITKLADNLTKILTNTVDRIKGIKYKHSNSIEDLKFADSLVNYSKLLYNQIGQQSPVVLDELYEQIKLKWNTYHQDQKIESNVEQQAKTNIKTFSELPQADLFFQAYDVVGGELVDKPLAKARREMIRLVEPSLYSVRLMLGSDQFIQQTNDQGLYPTLEQIEQGVVGVLVDKNNNLVYLGKDGLTTNPESAEWIEYEVEGKKLKSPVITFPFTNKHQALKDEFKKSTEKDSYVFDIINVKKQVERKEFKSLTEAGFDIEDIQLNIIKDDPYAGVGYVIKDGRQVIVNTTSLNDQEVSEVVNLLAHTYEEQSKLEQVVSYLNDLISSSDKMVREGAGREIVFYPSVDKIMVKTLRIKDGDMYKDSPDQTPIYYEDNPELINKALRAARIRLRKGEGANLQTSWTKFELKEGELIQSKIKDSEGKKFYIDHIKDIKVEQITSSQLAVFTGRRIPTKEQEFKSEPQVGLLSIKKDHKYTIGEINQLVMQPLTKGFEADLWNTLYYNTKVTPKFIFTEYDLPNPKYYDPKTKNIYIKLSQFQKDSDFDKTRGMIEELLHAMTIPKLNEYKDSVEYKALEEDYQIAKELKETYKETEQYQSLSDTQKVQMDRMVDYYLQNIEEFTVGISDPYFRAFLRLGQSKDQNLLESLIERVKQLLNKILKGVAPSLYTDVTSDVFNFIFTKPTLLESETKEEEKEEFTFIPRDEKEFRKFFSPISEESNAKIIDRIDLEMGNVLFDSGAFGDFVQGNAYTEQLWGRLYNYLGNSYKTSTPERKAWIQYFVSNEKQLLADWQNNSKLFKFSGDRFVIEDDLELTEDELAETPNEEQGKDPGYNRVDSEQKYSRLQLADKYAKILVKLTPNQEGTELADFTSTWNRLQNELKNTLSFDEQLQILSSEQLHKRFPESKIIFERISTLPKDISNTIIVNSFQKSFSTAYVPVYSSFFTKTDQGYNFSFFEQSPIDIQNLETQINQGFRNYAEGFNYDQNTILNKLKESKDIVSTYREIGFPIPDDPEFIAESGLYNFNQALINLLQQRVGKVSIVNGDLLGYIKGKQMWEEFGNRLGSSLGIPTHTNRLLSALAKYSNTVVSNMTSNAEGQNQSVLLSWSSWLIGIKEMNDGINFREKNPIFKYALTPQLIDVNNQIKPINLSGSRYFDGDRWEGTNSMDQDFLTYLRQEISTFMLRGVIEINRAETKSSSFGYEFNWGSKHPIKLENFKTDNYITDVRDIYISNFQNSGLTTGYLRGELERIKNSTKKEFDLFTFLSKGLKENLLKLEPEQAVKTYQKEILTEVLAYFNNEVKELKEEVFAQTGIEFNQNHPSLNVPEIQTLIKQMTFPKFLLSFVINRNIYETEHFIVSHGDVGQHTKPYKRFGSNISTGTPVVINDSTYETLELTKERQYSPRIPTGRTFTIKDDNYKAPIGKLIVDNIESLKLYYKRLGINKTDKQIEEEAVEKSKPYEKTNVADGQGFMTPDFGRMLMMTTGNWTVEREEGFWFLKIQHKKDQAITLTPEEQKHYDYVNSKLDKGIYWQFPPLKMQYRGEFIAGNTALEGLDKFSLAWLWPNEQNQFSPVVQKMLESGYDYGKFESATKIATPIPDDLLSQLKEGKIEITSGHDIDLKYLKEQVSAGEKFKDKMPMSTQARKLILSNLKVNGEYLTVDIEQAATKWKQSQKEISDMNISELLEEISTDNVLDNKKLADILAKEIKKRDLPKSITEFFTRYGQPDYQRFEQSLSPQLVETLIYSLLKNRIVRPKFPGEHYIQVASTLYDNQTRDLEFYRIENGRTQPAECKIVLSGEFLKLLNLKEIKDHIDQKEIKPIYNQLSKFERLEYKRFVLNELLLDPVFVQEHKKELTVFSSRIPGQGYNSMDIQIVKEFLPTYLGPVIVPNPLATKKSGTDFDFDKLPTITPVLTKHGLVSNSKVNEMLEAVEELLLNPINFSRLVTPNSTDNIDQAITNTLDKLQINASEPVKDRIFSYVAHLRKWMATKMKDALGIGATNNTFYTLIQDADVKINEEFELVEDLRVPFELPFDTYKDFSYPLLENDVDKLEYVNQFINITVDIAGNDAIGYTGLKRDNSSLLLFLVENGVSFEDAFYFINQPIIFKYHQLVSKYLDQGMGTTDAKNQVITDLLGIQTKQDGKNLKKNVIYYNLYDKIGGKFTNLLNSISPKEDLKWNTATQKRYLSFYLVGLEMANKLRDAQTYNNFDTRPSPNLLYSQSRENMKSQVDRTGMFEGMDRIHNESVISSLNAHNLFQKISTNAFELKRDPLFVKESLRLGELIYDQTDKEKFFKKFDNDYLLAILQNFGTISKERVEKNLEGDLMKRWKQLKGTEGLTISKYITQNTSSKSNKISPTLFLGLDDDSQTLDQIANDLRYMLEQPNLKEWAKDFIETGLYSVGFNVSPTYYLKALPYEVVNQYLKEAYDNYTPSEQFIQEFSKRFRYERGFQFGQYFLDEYRGEGIKNMNRQFKQDNFNPESWRYVDYKLILPETNSEQELDKPCDLDIPF